MSDTTQNTIEYYKSELVKKDEVIEKLSEVNELKDKQREVVLESTSKSREQDSENQLKELKIQYQELSNINHILKIENENLKIKNEELLKDLKGFKANENEEKKDINDSKNSRESVQDKIEIAETSVVASVSEETEAVIPEGIKTGNLNKQSQLLKTFSQRYFVLTKDILYYYRSSNDPSSEKSIEISSDCNVKIIEGTKFDLEAKSRTFTLVADSEEERDSWIKMFKECNVNVLPSEKGKTLYSKKTENENDVNLHVIPEGIKSGNLYKQSHLLKTFNQRFFVLTKDKLYHYRSNDPSTQKSIDISSDSKVKISEGAKFDIETKSGTYKLVANSEEERDSWVEELEKCNFIVVPLEKKKSTISKES